MYHDRGTTHEGIPSAHHIELSVGLVVGHVAVVALHHQVQLQREQTVRLGDVSPQSLA